MRTNVFILTSWGAVLLIIEILAYGLRNVTLLRSRVETLRHRTGPTGMPYLEAGGVIRVIGRVKIAPGCRITKTRSGRRKVAV